MLASLAMGKKRSYNTCPNLVPIGQGIGQAFRSCASSLQQSSRYALLSIVGSVLPHPHWCRDGAIPATTRLALQLKCVSCLLRCFLNLIDWEAACVCHLIRGKKLYLLLINCHFCDSHSTSRFPIELLYIATEHIGLINLWVDFANLAEWSVGHWPFGPI